MNILGGANSAAFQVSTANFVSDQTATVTATLSSQSQSFTFRLTAPVPPNQPPPSQPAGPVPTISGIPAGILDAASYTAAVVPGSIFVVKGSDLSPNGVVQASSYPLATTLNGVSISFAPAGGSPIAPYMLYTYNVNGSSQLAAVLPSTLTSGVYSVTVTNNGVTSTPAAVTVVPRKFELITADSSGTGAAALQNQNAAGTIFLNRFTTGQIGGLAYAPAHPGDFLIAYGTGLGPIQGPDNTPPGPIDFTGQVDVQVLVGGRALTASYAGRSPSYPGMDQINVQLPADIPTGCTVSFQVSVAGQLSNPTNVAIAPAGDGTCSPAPFPPDVLSRLDQGGSLTMGNFLFSQLSSTLAQPGGTFTSAQNESAFGAFTRYSGFQLASATAWASPPGSCQLFQIVGSASQLVFGPVGTSLDAGMVFLNGPNVPDQTFTKDPVSGTYSLALGVSGALTGGLYLPLGFPSYTATPVITTSNYQLLNGYAGGRDIGHFTASVTVEGPVVMNGRLPLNVDRTQDLTLNWTSLKATDLVTVSGASGFVVGGTSDNPIYQAVTFVCVAAEGAGTLTIPSSLLMQMPATPSANGVGYLQLVSGAPPTPGNGWFSGPLQTGVSFDGGAFLGRIGFFSSTSYQ